MRLPRMSRISASLSFSRSIPSKLTEPPTVRPMRSGSRRSTDSAVTLLPQPDSPTMPSVSPGPTWNETPATARLTPSSVTKSVLRSLTSSRGGMLTSPPPCNARIEPVTQSVADEVDGEYDQCQRQAGTEHGPRGPRQIDATGSNHVAPRRNLGWRAGAKE